MITILIIDDDNQVREMLKTMLVFSGYQVLEACDGNEGLSIFKTHLVDLVITDILMPKKDGLETILDIQREFPGTKIIAISGGGRIGPESYLKLAKSFGAQSIITKPFTRLDVLPVIEEMLKV